MGSLTTLFSLLPSRDSDPRVQGQKEIGDLRSTFHVDLDVPVTDVTGRTGVGTSEDLI